MSIFTAAELREQIALWKAALASVSTGQAYTLGERSLTRADAAEIRTTLDWLRNELDTLEGRGGPHFTSARPAR